MSTTFSLRPPKTATWSLSVIFLSVCVVIYKYEVFNIFSATSDPHDHNYWSYPQTTVNKVDPIRGAARAFSLFFILISM